jgi:hypothetical protein
VVTAGAALTPVYEADDEEPYPDDENACHIASFAAKAAEWAVKSAQGSPAESKSGSMEAFTFACDAATRAGATEIVEQLESDLAGLYRVTVQGKWSDATPVPSSVFALLADEPSSKPWWKFW